MNTTQLEYHGDVDLQLLINDKVISIRNKNSGKVALTYLFAKAVTGNLLQSYDLPTFVDLQYSTDEQHVVWQSYLTQNVVVSERSFSFDNVTYNPGSWVAQFTAVIQYSSLREAIDPASQSYFKLVMFTGFDNTGVRQELAELSVSAQDLAKIIPGTSAIVKWNMRVINTQ